MNKKKKIVIAVIVAAVAASLLDVLLSEIRVRSRVSRVRLGMTEEQVREVCGPPTGTGRWSMSPDEGSYLEYAFPYWWDYLIWRCRNRRAFTDQNKPSIDGARKCQISFRTENGRSSVCSVDRTGPYSTITRVVKRRK